MCRPVFGVRRCLRFRMIRRMPIAPGYYGYDDPQDCGEWCDDDVPDVVEGYYDTLRPDVADGGFVFPRTDLGVGT